LSVTAVVGAQWGDEGKGRIVDYLAQNVDMVIRFQGGDNAGHTVVNHHGTFALHMVPSGIFNPKTICLVGAGTVVNPDNLLEELKLVEAVGIDTSNLLIEERAHLVMPYHPMLDTLQEKARATGTKIGTTKRGIGPAYADKSNRWGIRVGDILRPDYFRKRLENILPKKNAQIVELGGEPLKLEDLLAKAETWRKAIGFRIVDTLPMVREAVKTGKEILLEGQLGVMRDLDWGTYPFVTSSNPMSGGAFAGAGLPPRAITDVIGVVKAYCTSVGAGPFPTELLDDDGRRLRVIGNEYGATTGRERRCGWFDGVAIRHAAWLNGFTGLAITKLDVLDTFEELKICVGYELDGERMDVVPDTPIYERCTPVYETWEGWNVSTESARDWDSLPKKARSFLRRISEIADVPITFVSVGPERDQLVVLDPPEELKK